MVGDGGKPSARSNIQCILYTHCVNIVDKWIFINSCIRAIHDVYGVYTIQSMSSDN